MTVDDKSRDLFREASKPPEFHTRRANQYTLLILILVIVAVGAVVVFAKPAPTHPVTSFAPAAYVHLDACKSSLRGGGGSDDDIHRLGVATFAQGFGGWGSYWRGADGGVFVVGRFIYSYGWQDYVGHCIDRDYGPDWFN